MPRSPSHYKAESTKAQVSPITLVQIMQLRSVTGAAPVDLYLTDASSVVSWNGKEYTPCGLTYSGVKISKDSAIASSTLTLDNVNRAFSALVQYVRLNGTEIRVLRGFENTLIHPDGAQMIFVGHVRKSIVGEYRIEVELWADYSLKTKVPRRLFDVNSFKYLPSSKDIRQIFRV